MKQDIKQSVYIFSYLFKYLCIQKEARQGDEAGHRGVDWLQQVRAGVAVARRLVPLPGHDLQVLRHRLQVLPRAQAPPALPQQLSPQALPLPEVRRGLLHQGQLREAPPEATPRDLPAPHRKLDPRQRAVAVRRWGTGLQ